MRFCYADQPYLGCCNLYDHNHGDGSTARPFDGKCWDDPLTHRNLIWWLMATYPDGWAMSASSPSLTRLAAFLPDGARIGVWVKPFASFKPGVNPGYCWEPIVFYGGRKLGRDTDTVRDFVSENITLEKGFTGSKPVKVCHWIMDFLGYDPKEDAFDDLFVGSGAFGNAIAAWGVQQRIAWGAP